MVGNYDRLKFKTIQTENADSITITIFISFTVNKSGKVLQSKVEKTECSEYSIKQLDKKKIKKLEQEALRVINEMEDLEPRAKPTKFTQPIKMILPANQYLKNK